MKAMILAAGRGERMRPITDTLPKPLVEVAGRSLIERHLGRLAAAGVREVVINVSHLADLIMTRLGDGRALGLEIAWSRESVPLETAGGIAQARELLGPTPFLLVNADIWCDFDFSPLIGMDLGTRLSHLVLVPNPPQHPAGDFTLHEGWIGNAAGETAAPRYTYSGISLIAPQLVAKVAAGQKAQLAPLWRAAADRGAVSGELHRGQWDDVGTPQRLAALQARIRET
jgi:N-acetyl-alpha-D-muramate 1-phosphate uridylyltransferase